MRMGSQWSFSDKKLRSVVPQVRFKSPLENWEMMQAVNASSSAVHLPFRRGRVEAFGKAYGGGETDAGLRGVKSRESAGFAAWIGEAARLASEEEARGEVSLACAAGGSADSHSGVPKNTDGPASRAPQGSAADNATTAAPASAMTPDGPASRAFTESDDDDDDDDDAAAVTAPPDDAHVDAEAAAAAAATAAATAVGVAAAPVVGARPVTFPGCGTPATCVDDGRGAPPA
mmetsp:Transcript_12425/g.35934  ORF Transcript_12425/g.35934 Transcript_12425/m.35934 type:complete len:231 (+) Transcript_12425:986-1678(+)